MMSTVVRERYSGPNGSQMPVEVDEVCAFLGELEDGAAVVLNTSSVAWVSHVFMQIRLFGSDGSLTFQDDWGVEDSDIGRILARRKNDPAATLVSIPRRLIGEFAGTPEYHTPFRGCFGRMASELIKRHSDFHNGWYVQEVMDAVLQSDEERAWITIPT